MKKLIITKQIISISEDFIIIKWAVINSEISESFEHIQEIDRLLYDSNIQYINDLENSIKNNLLNAVNIIYNNLYIIINDIIDDDFYIKTQEDGRKAVNDLMRELALFSYNNNLPRNINRKIEDTFKPVTDALLWGWWKTAKEKCEELESEIDNVIITQQLYDKIYNSIVIYININYPF